MLKAGKLPALSVLGLFQLGSFCLVSAVVVLYFFLFSFLRVFFSSSYELMLILAVNYRYLMKTSCYPVSGV